MHLAATKAENITKETPGLIILEAAWTKSHCKKKKCFYKVIWYAKNPHNNLPQIGSFT